jgi:hypothetical protein
VPFQAVLRVQFGLFGDTEVVNEHWAGIPRFWRIGQDDSLL